MNLSDLHIGQKGIITSIELPLKIRRKFTDMGLTIGVEVIMRNKAPLGDPLWLEVRGYDLTLRKSEAEKIHVRAMLD
ncbi:MAG: FeoA family protein [Bacillota bacterium]|jgi:Fe2+ transport system protein FeoA